MLSVSASFTCQPALPAHGSPLVVVPFVSTVDIHLVLRAVSEGVVSVLDMDELTIGHCRPPEKANRIRSASTAFTDTYMSWHGAAMPEWGSGHARPSEETVMCNKIKVNSSEDIRCHLLRLIASARRGRRPR